MARLFLRCLTLFALAMWFGGFTFYTAVVVRVGDRVLESRMDQGFVTQQVTDWLNLIGLMTLAILIFDLAAHWKPSTKRLRLAMSALWLVMVIAVGFLYVVHGDLDRLMDKATMTVTDRSAFRPLHRRYLQVSTVHWVACLSYIALMIQTWTRFDRATGRGNVPE